MMHPDDMPQTEADQIEVMLFELAQLDEADQDEQARRESGYYDEVDRIAFEGGH